METRWERISAVFDEAMARDPAERPQFVGESCADEPEIRRQVESMLAETDRPQLIDRPALESIADLLASETLIGAQIGPYRIESLLGAGGMGEVYRATDMVLGRQVAVKMLPAVLAEDPDRLARFHREARLLAALNHPNISAIYGTEALPGQTSAGLALILELVEGLTLADKVKAGRLPVDEAVAIARQLADALEAAHRQGIIHRDLKPSNIAIAPDGTVKVLDFGLAKLTQRDGDVAGADATTSPTITAPHLVTGAGVLLGTAAYMSPEQAKAREADHRSDIWAFGCVLFEMLTGRRAFDGEDPVEVLGAVVRLEPDWRALPPDVPIPLRTLLEGCLVKDRRRRIGDISTARFVLDHLATLSGSAAISSGAAKPGRRYLVAALAVALLTSAVAGGGRLAVAASAAPDRRHVPVLADRGRGHQRGPGQHRPGNPSRRPALRVHRTWCSGQRSTTLCPVVGSTRAEGHRHRRYPACALRIAGQSDHRLRRPGRRVGPRS